MKKEFDHEGGRVVHERDKLKYRRDVYRYTSFTGFAAALLFGMNALFWGFGGGLAICAFFYAVMKSMDKSISAYDERQSAVVNNIWQE